MDYELDEAVFPSTSWTHSKSTLPMSLSTPIGMEAEQGPPSIGDGGHLGKYKYWVYSDRPEAHLQWEIIANSNAHVDLVRLATWAQEELKRRAEERFPRRWWLGHPD